MSRRDRAKANKRRAAHAQQAAAKTGGGERRDRAREEREALASIEPSAARVPFRTEDGAWRSVDPVALALGFSRGLLSLQGSGSAEARVRAAGVHQAIVEGQEVPSGLTLAEVLDLDRADVPGATHDGTLAVAAALETVGAKHDGGELDLYGRVAPLGQPRHPHADEIAMITSAVVPEDDVDDDLRPRMVLTAADGWFEVWPPAALTAASMGVLSGGPGDAVGEGLYAWLLRTGADRETTGQHRAMFGDADLPFLLQTAAARAGSDHPALAGPVLLTMLAPPASG